MRLGKILKRDFPMKVGAVVIAIIIWFALSITMFPTVFMTIKDVPVTISLEGTTAEAQGLAITEFNEDTKVEVSISGMRYEIGSFTEDDLKATVDMSGVTQAGTYDLNINVTSSAASCSVTKITPSTVRVKVDYIKQVTIPLQVRATSVSAEDGYSLGDAVVTPETITVRGPEKLVDSLGYAVFAVDQKKKLSETYTTSDGKLYLYSNDNSLIDDSSFELDYDPISVTFPVYFMKTLKFSFDYQGAPDNFDTDILKYKLSQDSIDVMTANESVLNQDVLHLGYINLSDINLEKSFTFDVNLDSGVSSPSGIRTVTVTFDPTGFVSKQFTIPESNIKMINVPANRTAELSTKAISEVTIYGPADVMETLTADDLIAEFDMQSTVLENGTYTRNVRIYAPQVDTVWCYGNYEIMFTVSERSDPTAAQTVTTTTTTAR